MSRSVTFNGVTRYRPGGITRINADALNQVGASAGGVVGLIGEADGGAPGATSGLVSVRDPATAADIFKSGPLVDAIKLAFQSSADPLIPGGAAEVVVYKTNASTKSSVHLPSLNTNAVATTTSGVPTTTVLPVAATLVADALVGRWATINVASLSSTFLRKVTANTTSQITVSPALPAAPVAGELVLVRSTNIIVSSRDYGLHTAALDVTVDYNAVDASYQVLTNYGDTSQLSTSLGGVTRNYLHVVYRGGAIADSTTVTAGSTVSIVSVTPASLVLSAHVHHTFILRDASGNLKAISRVTDNTTGSVILESALSAVPVVGDLVELRSVTVASGMVSGANGVATAFATTITGVTGDDLSLPISASMTVRQLAAAINTNPNYLATVPATINGDTALASQLDWGSTTSTSMQTSYTGTVATAGFRQDLQEIVSWINNNAVNLTAARATADALDGSDGNVVDYPGATGDALPYAFQLAGGARGISTNSTFQLGFDAMLLRPVDEVVPLLDQDLTNEGYGSSATWAAVSAQLVDHVTAARGAAGVERGGWIGVRGTKTAFIAAANSINDMDVVCVAQSPTVVGSTGELVLAGPRELAVMGASMRCGVSEVGEPLTHKWLRVSALTQDSSWSPASSTDSGDLVMSGCMFAETIPGKGTRWVRDMTTWIRDSNLAFSEGSVRDVVRHVAYNLRIDIEDRFTGRKATPATVASVKEFASSLMEVYRTDNIIVDSTDPATGNRVHAYYNLKVTTSGDILRLNVAFFPAVGINFELLDLYLSLPTQSA